MQISIKQTHIKSLSPNVLAESSGNPPAPCPIRRTPVKHATARLKTGSRVRKANKIARRGGIKESHP